MTKAQMTSAACVCLLQPNDCALSLTCMAFLVYEAVIKDSGLNDLESKHLAKRAKHSHRDTGWGPLLVVSSAVLLLYKCVIDVL